eukprot:jgi/Botrbrau1/1940/Bobra.0005s0034.1
MGSGPAQPTPDIMRLGENEAHKPRAPAFEGLKDLQKSATKPAAQDVQERLLASFQGTLKSNVTGSVPTIIKGEPTVSAPVRTVEDAEAELMEELSDAGLKATVVFHNLTPAELYEKAILYEEGSHIVSSGALATLSGAKTGRSPQGQAHCAGASFRSRHLVADPRQWISEL